MKTAAVVSLNPASFEAVALKDDWRGGIRRVGELGFDGVELHLRDAAAIPTAELLELLAATGLPVPALGTGQVYGEDRLSFADPDPAVRRAAVTRVRGHVALAAQLPGRPCVIIGLVRGTVAPGQSPDEARALAVDGIAEVAAAASETGLRLVVEPINRYETRLGNTVAEVLELVQQTGCDNVGVLADTFHMNLEEVDLPAALRKAGSRLWHVHSSDSNRWAPLQGHLDFPAVIGTLRELNYDGYLSCEILPKPTPEAAVRLGAEGLRRLLERGEGR
ncbi:MAG: 5-keto-L-gluconate epimerase [Mycobacterium leprae]